MLDEHAEKYHLQDQDWRKQKRGNSSGYKGDQAKCFQILACIFARF